MSKTRVRINPGVSVSQYRVGASNTLVLGLDDYAEDVSGVIDFAINSADFEDESTTMFPGIRAKLPREYVVSSINNILGLICKLYSVPRHLKVKIHADYYAVVSRPESLLTVRQCIPHYDNVVPYSFAILHYLNPGKFGGTGYFKHKPTGYEIINGSNVDVYHQNTDSFFAQNGEPERRYQIQSNDHYELIGAIDYKPNRLMVYPSGLLHSGLINAPQDLLASPVDGRLTTSIFINFY